MTDNKISSDLLRGHTDTIILKLLMDGDKYGYEITKLIQTNSRGEYELKEATMYSSLKRLEGDGCINSYWGDETQGGRRKYYQITKTGKQLYSENKKILCTGGWGSHFNTSPLAHAVYSKAYLLQKGIPEHAFLELALSANTVEDAVKSKAILSRLDNPIITIVTSDFHIERVKLIFSEVLKGFEIQFNAVPSDFLDSNERERLVAHEQSAIRAIIQNGLYF